MAEVSEARCVLLASANGELRLRLNLSLTGMRWKVCEARGGAEALAQMEEFRPEALLIDHWLPDLEAGEFAMQIAAMYPWVDLLWVDGEAAGAAKSPRRHELLHALRETATTEPADAAANEVVAIESVISEMAVALIHEDKSAVFTAIEGMVGESKEMQELARLIRLVAPTTATVLIEGETGTGKEVVANALHRLSARASKAFCVLNCAAIPEALLEAELFGHTRGAFTGAVTSRTGRIEAAHGGTLFLDEIGEMPMALQAKMLRFLECGELQRVGENEVIRVDVRVIAATHQHLEEGAAEGKFRLDLYHRLAVFPVTVPALRERMGDISALAEFFLAGMGKAAPRKRLTAAALVLLQEHHWPGNVRELAHVLERGAILAGSRAEIGVEEIRLRHSRR